MVDCRDGDTRVTLLLMPEVQLLQEIQLSARRRFDRVEALETGFETKSLKDNEKSKAYSGDGKTNLGISNEGHLPPHWWNDLADSELLCPF